VNALGYGTSAVLRMLGVSMIFRARSPSAASAAPCAACSRCHPSHCIALSPRDGEREISRSLSPDDIGAPVPLRGRGLPVVAESYGYE
jgi:hypothetical protein